LDRDRRRAVVGLADAAEASRSRRRSARALAAAAVAAFTELGDRALGERLFRRAAADAAHSPALGADVARARLAALRALPGGPPEELLAALRDASAAARRAGDHEAARALRRDAAIAARAAGRPAEAAEDLLAIEALAAERGDGDAGALALEAGALLLGAGDARRAVEALRRAVDARAGGAETRRLLGEACREAARAALSAGDEDHARSLLCDAFEAWPADGAAFADALRAAAADPERIDAVLSARARAVPAEAAACHRARADALAAFGDLERAIGAYEAAVAAEPADVAALVGLAGCVALARGDDAALEVDARIAGRADPEPGEVPAIAEAPSRYRLGFAAVREGRHGAAIAHLERALLLAGADPRADAAWDAIVDARAASGDAAGALAAARGRAERAQALGLDGERRDALEAGVALAAAQGDAGPDAAELLDALLGLRAASGDGPDALAELARRAAAALERSGHTDRARAALARAGLARPTPSLELVATPDEPPRDPGEQDGLDVDVEVEGAGELDRDHDPA
ncbi:MAG TPA: hypothetical protein VM753_15795, partial [Anaeromyxobacter sp.]|nr:hypothetical protein [Anaeromyxobacter sp.]